MVMNPYHKKQNVVFKYYLLCLIHPIHIKIDIMIRAVSVEQKKEER